MKNKSVKERQHVSLKEILKTYFTAAKQYPVSGILTFVFYGCGTLLSDLIIKLYYRDIFDIITGESTPENIRSEIFGIFSIILCIIVIYNICYRLGDQTIVYFQTNIIRDLINSALIKIQHHSYNFFVGNFTGSLVAKTRRYVRAFETLHSKMIFEFWFPSIQISGIFIILFLTLPILGIFFAIWITLLISTSYFYAKFRLKYDYKEAEADSNVTGHLSDIITNILNLKMFASGRREMDKFSETTQKEFLAKRKTWQIGNIQHAFQGISMALLEGIGMYITLNMWLEGRISGGTVVLIQMYFYMVMSQVWRIGYAITDVFKALSDAEEMVSIFQKPLEINNQSSPEEVKINKGAITLQNMTFGYKKQEPIFKDFSLHIPSGQKVGIVGHSGVGKSTLFKLLLRFVDVTNGSINIDDQDIRNITQDDLRRNISYVPQEPMLFHRSLYENIAYASPDSSLGEVIEAAKRAHAHDFIVNLSNQYDTLVGERGVKLSGGERQRVAIARVILKDAPILLLDEATSSLDSISEKYVQEQLASLMERKTTLAIAHRISTIQQMDRIIVLNPEGIVEDGSHEDLLKNDGVYADLWKHQSHGFIIDEEALGSEGI